MRHYYRGRERIQVYHYSTNGKFIKKYDTIADARAELYPDIDGVYPMFRNNESHHLLRDGSILFKERTYRDQVVRVLATLKNPLVFEDKKVKPFTIYNIKGEAVATFINVNAAVVLTGMTYAQIMSMLTNKKTDSMPHNKLKISCRWECEDE